MRARSLLLLATMTATGAAAQAVVVSVPTSGAPTARRSSGLAVDRLSPGFYAYGGFVGGAGAGSDFVSLALGTNTWSAVPVMGANQPGPRERHGLATSASGLLVLVGGANASAQMVDQTWLFAPGDRTWRGPFAPTPRPPALADGALHWVPQLGAFLYFGGITGVFSGTRTNALWQLDTSDGGVTWLQRSPSGTAPSGRNAACTGYDPVSGRLIVFGGQTSGAANSAQTFSYDVATDAWRDDAPTGAIPSARAYCQTAFDESSRRLLLYGGQGTSNPIGGAFAYDPVARVWADVTPTMNVGVRSDGSAAHAPSVPGIFFFGGRTSGTAYTNETVHLFLETVDAGLDGGTSPDAGGRDGGAVIIPDGGASDGGASDGGASDGGASDGGASDGGASDGGASDDAGTSDAGTLEDGGLDAGPASDGGASPSPGVYDVGCGCHSGPGVALLLGLVLLTRSRRRR